MHPQPTDQLDAPPPKPNTSPRSTSPRFVTFHIGPDEYAIHTSLVSLVTSPLDPTPLPESIESVRGIAAVKGEIVAVVNAFGERERIAGDPNAKPKAVVLRSPQRGEQIPMAFNVDRVDEMVSFPYRSIVRSADASPHSYIAEVGGRRLKVLEWSWLESLLKRS